MEFLAIVCIPVNICIIYFTGAVSESRDPITNKKVLTV